MSLTLLKKSLDILENTPSKDANTTRATTKCKQKSKRRNYEQKHPTKERKIIKLMDVRQEINQGDKKSKENLRKLLALSKNTLKEADAKKFVKRAHKGRYEEIEIPKREIESIFTEDDFRAFEEEYFKSQ